MTDKSEIQMLREWLAKVRQSWTLPLDCEDVRKLLDEIDGARAKREAEANKIARDLVGSWFDTICTASIMDDEIGALEQRIAAALAAERAK